MDAAALAGLCALLAHGAAPQALPEGVTCPAPITAPAGAQVAVPARLQQTSLAGSIGSADARDGIARVAYAEAANQGDSGLAAVVYTILNRLEDGRWGATVDAVLDAPHQFEPVLRAGGSWRNLRPVSEAQRARIDTIINLALDGRLPDLTNGARYFQNPKIVALRAANGQVAATLVNFGGAAPSAVIGAHSFYVDAGRGGGRRPAAGQPARHGRTATDVVLSAAGGAIFVGENRGVIPPAGDVDRSAGEAATAADSPTSQVDDAAGSTDPARAIFVHSDGRASAYRR
jgi:N-acetylmuramoyl-L-alanine amidase